ncbi:adenylate/guanylate cyclase domain-containing protein [Leptolyngbya sp. 'hensonii']|uniref:adenylate/guanylate cyclase domain-containing protein n=1 Tax=Leptolyngbya sp. 'hensonii' TaxID=1922337 RepID=UPI000950050E|nr:adenylate/guanylate cyclase domain-containing protein [Leptolyngbya sp. 'hensonii']OLP15652.1 adenylate/guanylate cyclase domain-containing protein [Leptolyngbya sp. 'hensonii']
MPQIYYLPDERLVEVDESEVILEASLRSDIPHTHVCGGNARCSTCRVLIVDGLEYCTPRNPLEEALTEKLHLSPTIRLACQTQLQGSGKVTLRRLALDVEDIELLCDQVDDRNGLGMIGEEKEIAILFADIRGFTSFSETVTPYDVIYLLNRYFQRMGEVIQRYDGMINNYMGDGMMVLFGVENSDRIAERAVRTGVEMLEALEKLNPYLETLYHRRLKIGIGIHYGPAVVGSIGAFRKKVVTAIGDAVNFASRIESANKQVGTSLLISEAMYEQVKDLVIVNQAVQVQVPGKTGEYRLYEIIDVTETPCQEQFSSSTKESVAEKGWMARLNHFWQRLLQFIRGLIQPHHSA